MNFLRSLFGGGGRGASGDPNALYLYIQPKGCDEVVRVRINLMNDLSESDEGQGYIVHKVARGIKCRQNVELFLTFNAQRKLVEQKVDNGKAVDAAAYDAWLAANPPPNA